MAEKNLTEGYRLVTALVKKHESHKILTEEMRNSCLGAHLIKSRGTLLKEHPWFGFLSSVSPETEVLKILVPTESCLAIMDKIVEEGKLFLAGSGSIFSLPCLNLTFLSPYDKKIKKISSESPSQFHYSDNKKMISCLVQKNSGEKVAKAAMQAGSPGPTTMFGVGRGIRDRLGLLRIAIDPEKEILLNLVDSCDVNSIFESMILAGDLHLPGGGFAYITEAERSLVNSETWANKNSHSASMAQVIKAIDELKGTSHWRQDQTSKEESIHRIFLEDLISLTCVVERGSADILVQRALEAGVPGASTLFGNDIAHHKEKSGYNINQEKELIEFVLSPDKAKLTSDTLLEVAEKEGIKELLLYSYKVEKAFTYL